MLDDISYQCLTESFIEPAIELCGLGFGDPYIPYAREDFPSALLDKDRYVYVAQKGQKLVGIVALWRHIAAINNFSLSWLTTHPDYRNHGIARGLLTHCETQVCELLNKEQGAISFLCREELRPFYEQFGYKGNTVVHGQRIWMAKILKG